MKPKRMTTDDMREFVERMQFLEDMWGARTHYTVDSETGRGDVQICPPTGETVLFLNHIDVRSIKIVGRHRGLFPDLPPSE